MNYAEARAQLLLHAGCADAAGPPLAPGDGFLVSLRPYQGLHEKNFHLVMEALLVLGDRLHLAPQIDRDVVHAVWWICCAARRWGLHPDGMLQTNRLITVADTTRLELWVNTIDRTVLHLLAGSPPHWAVMEYAKYVVAVGWWDNIAFFVPLFGRAVSDPELPAGAIEVIVDALGKIGGPAARVLPVLREAEHRSYTWVVPEDRCTDELRARIREAIQAIEHDDPVVGTSENFPRMNTRSEH